MILFFFNVENERLPEQLEIITQRYTLEGLERKAVALGLLDVVSTLLLIGSLTSKKSVTFFGFCCNFFQFIFCFSKFFLFRTAFMLPHLYFQITLANIIWNLLPFKLPVHTGIDC